MKVLKNTILIFIAIMLFLPWSYFLIALCMVFYFGTIPPGVSDFVTESFSSLLGKTAAPIFSHFLFLPVAVFVLLLLLCLVVGRLRALVKTNGIVLIASGGALVVASLVLRFLVGTGTIDREMAALAASVPKQFSGTAAVIADGFFETVLAAGTAAVFLSVLILVIAAAIGKKKHETVAEKAVAPPAVAARETPVLRVNTPPPPVQPEKIEQENHEVTKEAGMAITQAVAISREKPVKQDGPQEKAAQPKTDWRALIKKIAPAGMRILAGVVAGITAFAITASLIPALWAFVFPCLTFLLEKQLDRVIARITPWKKNMKKMPLLAVGIIAPACFSLLLTLLFNAVGLGPAAAVLLVFIVPPFSYLIGRKPALPAQEA